MPPETPPDGEGWERWRGKTSEQLQTLIKMHGDTKVDISRLHERVDDHIADDSAEFKKINAKLNWWSGAAAVVGTVVGWLIPGGGGK